MRTGIDSERGDLTPSYLSDRERELHIRVCNNAHARGEPDVLGIGRQWTDKNEMPTLAQKGSGCGTGFGR